MIERASNGWIRQVWRDSPLPYDFVRNVAGRSMEIGYRHLEKLTNLDKLPPFGFRVSRLPVKVKAVRPVGPGPSPLWTSRRIELQFRLHRQSWPNIHLPIYCTRADLTY